jgi:GT2 family glycosyltransferase
MAAVDKRVAVVIVNYNSRGYIARCLTSVAQQSVGSFRTIVVDNRSTDGSADDLERKFPWIELLRAGRNLGFAAANNLGAAHAAGSEWIVTLNPDAFPQQDWLEKLLAAAQAQPEFSFFGGRTLVADAPDLLDGVGDIYHVSGLHWREGHRRPVTPEHSLLREIFAPCAAAAMYRRDAFQAVGGFDEDFFCYAEDMDLGFRLRLAGHRALYVPDAVVLHVGSGTTGWRSDFSVYYGQRNLVWTYAKNMPGVLALLYLPLHVLTNFLNIGVLALRGQGWIALRAKVDALRGLPMMLAKRGAIHARRQVPIRQLLSLMARGWPDRQATWSKAIGG